MIANFRSQILLISVCVLSLLSTSLVKAESLCRGVGKLIELSISESSNCSNATCTVKREGAGLYFEVTPSGCGADGAEFRLSVKIKQVNIKPTLKCDGNAVCPSSFSADGTATISQVQGKASGRVSTQKSKRPSKSNPA